MPKCDGNTDARLRELEIKFTFLDDFVSEQNKTLTELLRENDCLKRALRSLAEKIETLDGNGNVPPANEKPPHW